MNPRRTFLQTSLGAVAGAAFAVNGRDAAAETKPALTSPKVVSGDEGTKVWAMSVLVTIKVKSAPNMPRPTRNELSESDLDTRPIRSFMKAVRQVIERLST